MPAAIATHKLSKSYPGAKYYALHELSIEVQPGEVYGYLGANGAGKSTTIRTLLNFIRPSSGSAKILGYDSVRDSVKVKRHVGYLSGDAVFYAKMTGQQFLSYMAELQPLKHKEYYKHLLSAFQAQTNQPIRQLSKGNRQKLGLIQAFMHEPEVLILDEPTSGLDPLMQEVFFNEVKAAKARGASVLASSHNLGEVQRMCDRVGFIRGGRLQAEKSIAELVKTSAQTFDITFSGKVPLSALRIIPHAEVKQLGPERVAVRLRGEVTPLLAVLAHEHVLRLDKPGVDLEEEFMHFYTDKPAAQQSGTDQGARA